MTLKEGEQVSAVELARRLKRLRAAKLEPTNLVMPPATWAELVADPDAEATEIEGAAHRFTFNGVPVERVEGAAGIAIIYMGVERVPG